MVDGRKIAILGAGRIGESLIAGLLSSGWRRPEEIAATARRYLAVSLRYLGYIPNDEELARADTLSTCVVDAFPAAPAAVAFRELARTLMGDTATPSGARQDEPFRDVMKFAE